MSVIASSSWPVWRHFFSICKHSPRVVNFAAETNQIKAMLPTAKLYFCIILHQNYSDLSMEETSRSTMATELLQTGRLYMTLNQWGVKYCNHDRWTTIISHFSSTWFTLPQLYATDWERLTAQTVDTMWTHRSIMEPSTRGKITVGLVSHWKCFTQLVV